MTIVDEYLNHYNNYSKVYGLCVVFMQVGDFYEMYQTNNDGPDLSVISNIANIIRTKKDKSIESISRNNPYMCGFNLISLHKFLRILIQHSYTVIVIEQITAPPSKVIRKVTGIYSPGTFIDDTVESNSEFGINSNGIVHLYFNSLKQIKGNVKEVVGISMIDVTTGACSFCEITTDVLNNTFRILLTLKPKEVLVTNQSQLSKETIFNTLELNINAHYYDVLNDKIKSISYQNELLLKVYSECGLLTPIEYVNLDRYEYARISFVRLLDFTYQHNHDLINYLQIPIMYDSNTQLTLNSNAMYQLNILENKNQMGKMAKYRSLLDVINKTSTSMGRRYLYHIICNPLIDIDEIQYRYNCIEELLQNDQYINIINKLKNVHDIEKLFRKCIINRIKPYELYHLIQSLQEITKLWYISQPLQYHKQLDMDIESLNLIINDFERVFNLDGLSLNDMNVTIFNEGIDSELDALRNGITNSIDTIKLLCNALSKYIEDTKTAKTNKKRDPKDLIQLKRTDKGNYYLYLTKRRANLLKERISNISEIQLSENQTIKKDTLEFKEFTSYSKIFMKQTFEIDLSKLDSEMTLLVKRKYIKYLEEYKKYKSEFMKITKWITLFDFLCSGAKCAREYNYCKPELLDNSGGKVDVCDLRNPIIERIKTDVPYIPHSVSLGSDNKTGIILFGLNSAGKSTLMKSIAMNIIMAQCGLYTSARSFKYSYYTNIFTRISSDDNIFKGQSSFTLEMNELNNILNECNDRSFVCLDELVKSTEHKSCIAINIATICMLSEKKCNFISTSHIHEIAKSEMIKNLRNVDIYHLHVDYDQENNRLIFNRELRKGSGSDHYGLLVSKYLIQNNQFNKLTYDAIHEYEQTENTLLTTKQSRYNSAVYMDACFICKVKHDLHTHHINFTKNCDEYSFVIEKPHIKRNYKCNLLVLCESCHHKVHDGLITIQEYIQSSKGIILKYEETGNNNSKIE